MFKNMQVKKSSKGGGKKLDKVLEIERLFFEEHLKQKEIAKIIDVSPQYVSQVLKNNPKTKEEKDLKHEQSVERKKAYNRDYYKNYERPKKENTDKQEFEALQTQLAQDAKMLSAPSHSISNEQLVYCNLGAYTRNKNGNLVLDKTINATADMPKSFNRHRIVPSQKTKYRVCMER